MTENEALEILNNECEDISKVQVALKVAREALAEIQQYRKLGTVEEVKYLVDSYNGMIHDFGDDMSALEQYRAIGTVEDLKTMKENGAFSGVELAQIACMQMKLKDYQSIGTIEEFKALKEKNEPKKTIIHGLGQRYCPVCKCGGADHFYCTRCGQKLA